MSAWHLAKFPCPSLELYSISNRISCGQWLLVSFSVRFFCLISVHFSFGGRIRVSPWHNPFRVDEWLISFIWSLVPCVNPLLCLVGSFLGPRHLYTFLAARNICSGITYQKCFCARNLSFTLYTQKKTCFKTNTILNISISEHYHAMSMIFQCWSHYGPTINTSFDRLGKCWFTSACRWAIRSGWNTCRMTETWTFKIGVSRC